MTDWIKETQKMAERVATLKRQKTIFIYWGKSMGKSTFQNSYLIERCNHLMALCEERVQSCFHDKWPDFNRAIEQAKEALYKGNKTPMIRENLKLARLWDELNQ